MTEEFEGDLAGAVFWGADLTGAHFRDVNLTGMTITHAALVGVDIDALVDRLVVNGVDVTEYVNERDRWYPLRGMLLPTDPDGFTTAWSALQDEWVTVLEAANALPDSTLHQSVDGEWSFVETLRHLVFAMDKWFTAPVLHEPFHSMGLPNSGSIDFAWPDLELAPTPSFAEVLAARTARVDRFATFVSEVSPTDLGRSIDVLENGPHPMLDCLHTVLEEEFWHLRYATRDLEQLSEKA